MTFFFISFLISCKIIPLPLVLYVTQKSSLYGASLRNSSFSLCLTMSRMYLSKVILSQFSRKCFVTCLKTINLTDRNIYYIHFLISCVCPSPGFLIPVLELVFFPVPVVVLLEVSFCRDSSREALEVF